MLVVELLMAAIGLLLAGLAARNWTRGNATRAWPQTQGRILRSFVLVERSSGSEGGTSYTPQVEYEYAVGGASYRCNRLRYGQTGSWGRKQAERTIAPFAVGSHTAVFFNPADPKQAVLLRGTSAGNFAIAGAAFVFLAAAVAVHGHVR